MKIRMKATKCHGQLFQAKTYFSVCWIVGFKTVEEYNLEGVYYCETVRTSNKVFFLAASEELMKYFPGGYYLVMNMTPIFPVDRSVMDIGYNYNSWKVLGFISTEWSVSTDSGDPFFSCP